jgi:glycosyltransferase involved in cell wall biosynthesis
MIIKQIISHIDEEHSGPTNSVRALSEYMMMVNTDTELLCLNRKLEMLPTSGVNVRSFHHDHIFKKLGISKEMKSYFRDFQQDAVLHSHGLWMMPNIYPLYVKGPALKILSPRGTLGKEALKYSSFNKSLFWAFLQKKAFMMADAIHVTSHSELEEVRLAGFKKPIIVQPNGVMVMNCNLIHGMKIQRNKIEKKRAIFIGRIHPKKGLDLLLEAWSQSTTEGWQLDIFGIGEKSYVEKLKSIINLNKLQNVKINGPIYGEEKINTLSKYDLFILPTENENFGNVIAEALGCAVPVLTTKGAPWQLLEEYDAGWWVDRDRLSFKSALSKILQKSKGELYHHGLNGHALMESQFNWSEIAMRMLEAYQVLKTNSSFPDYIEK